MERWGSNEAKQIYLRGKYDPDPGDFRTLWQFQLALTVIFIHGGDVISRERERFAYEREKDLLFSGARL